MGSTDIDKLVLANQVLILEALSRLLWVKTPNGVDIQLAGRLAAAAGGTRAALDLERR